jgi:transcription elongation factor GreA
VTERVVMTEAGLRELEAELVQLETVERDRIAERIKTAREWGDLKENAEYHDAKNSQAMLETKILVLRDRISKAEIREAEAGGETVAFGATVHARDEATGKEVAYTLVSAAEAKPAEGRVSFDSPVGRALEGARVGDTVAITTPRGERRLVVERIA